MRLCAAGVPQPKCSNGSIVSNDVRQRCRPSTGKGSSSSGSDFHFAQQRNAGSTRCIGENAPDEAKQRSVACCAA